MNLQNTVIYFITHFTMLARFNKQTQKLEKTCSRCRLTLSPDPILGWKPFFTKNGNAKDGLNNACRECRKIYMRTSNARTIAIIHARRRRETDKKKNRARAVSTRAYAKNSYKCAVLNCQQEYDHLHHVDYDDPLAVVPLCYAHHGAAHSVVNPYIVRPRQKRSLNAD